MAARGWTIGVDSQLDGSEFVLDQQLARSKQFHYGELLWCETLIVKNVGRVRNFEITCYYVAPILPAQLPAQIQCGTGG